MNNNSRTKNSKRNLFVGFLNLIITTLISFCSRTVFVKILSADYLGVNGLYSNILSLLSLTELGLTNVALYSLYKPIAENDTKKINQLVSFFNKIFTYIFLIIIVIGISCIPILKYVINSELPMNELIGYYILYLLNSAISYIAISKQILINADQRIHVTKKAGTISLIIQNMLQIIVLVLTHNYYCYLIIQCLCTLLLNIYLIKKANNMYPFLTRNDTLPKEDKKSIFTKTRDLFIYKMSVLLINSTDNIFISVILGTIVVGYYSNYNMIMTVLAGFLNTIIYSINSSLGNLNACSTNDKKVNMFYKLLLAMQWLVSFFSIGMILLFNDFITLWIGSEYTFDFVTVAIIVFNFYISNITVPVWMYRETLGLFSNVRKIMLYAAVINVVLTYVLAKHIGLGGVFLATIVSRILTIVWYEPIVLLKNNLKSNPWKYFISQAKYISLFIIVLIILYFVTKGIVVNNLLMFFIKAVVIIVLFNLIYLIVFFRDEKFKDIKNKIINKVH